VFDAPKVERPFIADDVTRHNAREITLVVNDTHENQRFDDRVSQQRVETDASVGDFRAELVVGVSIPFTESVSVRVKSGRHVGVRNLIIVISF
jgi:hypothetical protein